MIRDTELKKEVIELAREHVKECIRMEKSGFKQQMYEDDSKRPKPTITSLPDIDDDRFQELRQNDRVIVRISVVLVT